MISVEEALEKVLAFVHVLEPEQKPLLDCLGCVLAEDIYASFSVPFFDNSAMDGYAIRSEDIKGSTTERPKLLRLVGSVAAGALPLTDVASGTAVRIMTGAPLPDGADVVIPFELTDEMTRIARQMSGSEIGILCELPIGSNIRKKGEDIRDGELVLKKGTVLRPAEIGVLASLGRGMVSIVRRPIIAILATGDEVLDLDEPLVLGKLYNSNSYGLAAQVINCGGIPKLLGIARDDIEQLTSALHRGLDADMVITSGGVSVGDYDKVKEVLKVEGDISFWTVCMKPGKPIAFGTLDRDDGTKVPHLGLPGNPVSSMITFELFARPAILRMMGRKNFDRPVIKAIFKDSLKNTDSRRIFARVVVTREGDNYIAHLTGAQGSGILVSMTKANGLAIIPEDMKEVFPNSIIDVIMLNDACPVE
jgi:molybdopterin molybdotransferase